MTINIWNGTTYNTAQDLLVWGGSSWTSPKAVNIWTGTEWVDGLTTITLTSFTVDASNPGAPEPSGSSAVYALYTNGYVYTGSYTVSQNFIQGSKWCNPVTHATNYDVFVTVVGTLDFGTVNSWVPITTNLYWRITAHGVAGDVTSTLTVQIRRSGTTKILSSATITLHALTAIA